MKNYRVFVEKYPEFQVEAQSLLSELNENLGLSLQTLRIRRRSHRCRERHTVRVGVELRDIRSGELSTTGVNLTGKLSSNLTVTQRLSGRLGDTLAVGGLNHLVNGGGDVGHVRTHSVGDDVGDTLSGESVNELLASDVSHSKFPSVVFLILG